MEADILECDTHLQDCLHSMASQCLRLRVTQTQRFQLQFIRQVKYPEIRHVTGYAFKLPQQ